MGSSIKTSRNKSGLWLLIGCSVLLSCIICGVVIAASLIFFASWIDVGGFTSPVTESLAEITTPYPGLKPAPTVTTPTMTSEVATEVSSQSVISGTILTLEPPAEPTPDSSKDPLTSSPNETPDGLEDLPVTPDPRETLLEMDYPPRDYFESARRLGSSELGPRTIFAEPYSLGARRTFNTDESSRDAELVAITEHAYFWVETSLNLDPQQLISAAEQFESEYYPLVTGLFGNEWQPGMDGDPRFSIFHLDGYADDLELGFFNSGDEYPRTVYSNSNEHELIYLNMANLQVGNPVYFGTLVHEYQHLIQWHLDPNEPVWFSEGLAQFTELYVGLDTVDSALDFSDDPFVQLNSWDYDDQEKLLAHYGAAYLFSVYVWEQLGAQALVEMVRNPADGLAALYQVLQQFQPERTFEQFLADWLVANYLDAEESDSVYRYQALNLRRPAYSTVITRLPSATEELIEPLSAHYIALDLAGEVTISFSGEVSAPLFPETPFASPEAWYVPGLNETDAQLTAAFDLSDLNDPELNFWTWYDLEEGFDFAYISISADGGDSWEFLVPDHATAGTYGPAFSGRSQAEVNQVSGWVNETISLWRYQGQEVVIRFEVLTDSAITGGGFAIGGIGLTKNATIPISEWLAEGFVRTGPELPHVWTVQLIQENSGQQAIPLPLDPNNQGQLIANLGADGGVLVVGVLTPYVDWPVAYQLSIVPDSG